MKKVQELREDADALSKEFFRWVFPHAFLADTLEGHGKKELKLDPPLGLRSHNSPLELVYGQSLPTRQRKLNLWWFAKNQGQSRVWPEGDLIREKFTTSKTHL